MTTIRHARSVRADRRTSTARETPTETQVVLPWTPADQAVIARIAGAEKQAARKQQIQIRHTRRALAALPPRRSVVHAVQTWPTVFVSAPRAVAAHYWQLPWADVRGAAEQGRDGLVVVTERPDIWRGLAGERPPNPPDVAYLAEGQDGWRGRTVLHQQNW